PQGQAEAELRMRHINGAFETIEQSRGRVSAAPVAPPDDKPPAQPPTVGRRLTKTEIDAIADALGAPRYAAVFGRLLAWALCLAGGLIMMIMGTQSATRMPIAAFALGLILLVAAAVQSWSLWSRRR